MTSKFQTIGLFGKYKDPSVHQALDHLTEFLKENGHKVLLGETTPVELHKPDTEIFGETGIDKSIDLGVVIGGDGTMLNVGRSLAKHNIPLVGINMGHLGFLADISAESMIDEISQILQGHHVIENRMMLRADVEVDGTVIHSASAFNDVVISKSEPARIIEFEVWADNELVTYLRGDGVIITTPTGSTAYALSAGGPILHPTLPAIALVPICPHALSNRPIVLKDSCKIEICVNPVRQSGAQISIDGHIDYAIDGSEQIRVQRADEVVQLVRASGHNHYGALRAKLGWGDHLQTKNSNLGIGSKPKP
ncbi:NAD(+)/NADH kinase [Pseudomonadota bacterium]